MQTMNKMMRFAVVVLCCSAALVAGAAEPSAVRKVVTLLEDMKSQVTKDAKDDTVAYDKYACWCETNKGEKNEAVESAQNKIAELEALVEQSSATQAQLKSEIESLESDIASDKDSLEKATAIRAKENDAFTATSEEMNEAITALTEAVDVLSKVNLLQKKGHGASSPKLRLLLLQARDTLKGIHAKGGMFRSVMQKDLWDVMSTLGAGASSTFLSRGSALAQEDQPKPKTAMEAGVEAKPNTLTGNTAGSKSYNSRSGEIYGLLKEMLGEFKRDLAEAEKTEADALKMFNDLKASKLAEIAAAEAAVDSKSAKLAAAVATEAQAKEDIESTTNSLTADEKFLLTLEENCKTADEEYAKRVKARDEEIVALSETLKILMGDEARALFGKTLSFLQINGQVVADSAKSKMINSAMQRVMRTARKHGNWMLASLAVRMRLDSFTKVKAMMDKMLADLKKEQAAEYEKNEYCLSAIDKTEDSIKVATSEKEDLTALKVKLEGDMSMLDSEITTLKKEVSDMEISLKQAGEERKAENLVYQQSVSDQRATIHVLTMAYDRLKVFYEPKGAASMAQVAQAPPPMGTGDYEKNAYGGGVLQMVATIIRDAKNDEILLVSDEQQSQADYAKFAADATASIESDKEQILEKTKQLESTSASKAETEASLLSNGEELSGLDETLTAHHADCDWVMKYFDVRQTARKEEMEAIAEAKAILSGANFGEALEAGEEAA